MRVLIALCLLTLTACSVPNPIFIGPPAAAMVPRATPVWEGETYRDLAQYALELQSAHGACEADKATIAKWAETMEALQ